ncbi:MULTISPECIES: hypothetical protein [Pseudomonas]|uniref:hypothetical protein n=1 Tax=Pseudomonas TaxID=286 RepID=UPI0008636210|nr:MULTISPECIES: hypothetical protein [Pseudomonas]MCL8308990.1 hypothetical protein [Pseudomonas putida]
MLRIQRFSFDEAVMGKRNLLAIAVALAAACAWVAGGRSASEAGLRDSVAACHREASQDHTAKDCSDKERKLLELYGESTRQSK